MGEAMAKGLQLVLLATAVLGGAANCLGRCGIALNLGNVGSCKFWGCSKSRGPTHCTLGSCFCNDGYCRYPVTTLHVQSRTCRQRAGEDICHATRICYNAGLTTTSCSGGLCFCKFGYRYNCHSKTCEYGGYAEGLSAEELMDVEAESRRETFFNVFVAGVWICGCIAMVIGGGMAWRSRSRKVEIAQDVLLG